MALGTITAEEAMAAGACEVCQRPTNRTIWHVQGQHWHACCSECYGSKRKWSTDRVDEIREHCEKQGETQQPVTLRGQVISALEAAQHVLTTLSGLYAYDGEAPAETWRLDESATIAQIDAALTALRDRRAGETAEGEA